MAGEDKTRRIVMAGGGTGGHIYPALAILEALRKKDGFEFLYVGGKKGLETEIIPGKNIAFKQIPVLGFQRRITWDNILFPGRLMMSLSQSRKILKDFCPQAAVGTGGYVSGPVIYSAAKMGIPVLIQEQNSYPGVTTRLLAKHADVLCLPNEGAAKFLKKVKGEILFTGNPVRATLKMINKDFALKNWNLAPNRPVVFIFGGSQGARSLNTALANMAASLIEKFEAQFIWQSGPKNFKMVKDEIKNLESHIRLLPYIDDMAAAYSAADIIVSRAGAITLAELAVAGKAAVLVPYPYAAGNHQEHNARFVEKKGAAAVVFEETNFESELEKAIEKLLMNKDLRSRMSAVWKELRRENAADVIADKIIELIKAS